MHFETPDLDRFPCLRLAREALRAGPTMTNVLNAANEVAVQAFLDGRLSFGSIPALIGDCLNAATPHYGDGDLDAILATDTWARNWCTDSLSLRAAG